MRIKDPEPAAWDDRRHIAAAVTEVGVGGEGGVFNQCWLVAVRIHRSRIQVIGPHRVVGREGRSDYLLNPHASSRECAI